MSASVPSMSRQPVVASATASSIFASKFPLIEAFATPIPDHEIAAHTKLVTSLSFSADNSQFASGSVDKSVKVWDSVTRQPIVVFMGNFAVNAVAFSPKQQQVLSAGDDRCVQLWDVTSKSSVGIVETPVAPVHALAFAPSGTMFAAGCAAGFLLLYVAKQSNNGSPAVIGASGTFDCEHIVIRHHLADVRAVAFSAEGEFLLSGSDDRSVKMFSVAPHSDQPLRFECLRTFDGHSGPVYGLSIAPDSVSFLSVGKDKLCKLWHIETGSSAAFEHFDELFCVAFSPDSTAFLTGGVAERRFWDASKKGCLFPEPTSSHVRCHAVAFASDGSVMLTSSNNTIRLTSNMHHARTLCRFVAWHHHEISEALSNDAWRVLTDAIRQQQQLQVRQYQQHQLAQLPDAPPATPYTHIDHFVNREGATFVHSAIARSDVRSLRTCLELGADVNRATRTTKRSPLHLAVERVCQLQFEAHADPSDPAGVVGGIGSKVVDMGSSVVSSVTNLISAKRVPAHDELIGLATMCVSVLIDAGADVNLQDRDANTVLHTAVKASHTLLVKCLLAAGADASIRNKGGHTPVSFARSLDTLEALLNNQNQRESRVPRTPVADPRSSASLAVHPVDDATVDPPLTRTSLRNSTANIKPAE